MQVHKKPLSRAYVLVPVLPRFVQDSSSASLGLRTDQARLEEAMSLTLAVDVDLLGGEIVDIRKPHPATLIGGGRIEELAARIVTDEIDLLVVDSVLSPVQQRNLETRLKTKVIDRTALILEIFGTRASTREGVLQVELAHLTYQKSRLVRSWTHLERQRGGAGFMGGPGERQIESDRRMLDEKIDRLKQLLKDVRRTRTLHRKSRQQSPHPVVALVGYTNAGKSTLFNRLTGADIFAADQLFATLDPTLRAIELPSGTKIILSDTVGFIADLPTQLIAAFQATLEEVLEADIILHVRDASSADFVAQYRDVLSVLAELGISMGPSSSSPLKADKAAQETKSGATPKKAKDGEPVVIEVLNKADLVEKEDMNLLVDSRKIRNSSPVIATSSRTGAGVNELLIEIENILRAEDVWASSFIPFQSGKQLAFLESKGAIDSRTQQDDGWKVTYHLSLVDQGRFAELQRSGK